MKKLIVILILIILGCKSRESLIDKHNNSVLYSNSLYPVKYDKLWGYADFYGNTIINPRFQEASLFQYGTAVVKQNNLYGYISNTGQWIIKPKYKSAGTFNLRYHGIKNKDGTSQENIIAKVNEGKGEFYIDAEGVALKRVELFNEIPGCVHILPRLDEYSIKNQDGTYELTYNYWRTTNDTSYNAVKDTTNLRLDTIIEIARNFALLKKGANYAIYNTKISRGIDVKNKTKFIIPKDSIHSVNPNFIYENVKFKTINGETTPSSIYKKNGKWGIITHRGNEIAPFIYLDIGLNEYYDTYLVEFEEQKYGYISIVKEGYYVYNNREKYKTSNGVVVEHFKRKKNK
jgi:hypothetical protein